MATKNQFPISLLANVFAAFVLLQSCGNPSASPLHSITRNAAHLASPVELCLQIESSFQFGDIRSVANIEHITNFATQLRAKIAESTTGGSINPELAFEISNCLKRSLTLAFQALDKEPESAFFDTKLIVSAMFAELYAARSALISFLSSQPSRYTLAAIIDNPVLQENVLSTLPFSFSLDELAQVVAQRELTPELEARLTALMPFADATTRPPQPSQLQQLSPAAQTFLIRMSVLHMARFAFTSSTRQHRMHIATVEQQIKAVEERLKQCARTKDCAPDIDIAQMRKNLEELKAQPSGPRWAFARYSAALAKANIPGSESIFQNALEKAKSSFAAEVQVGPLIFREGDVFTQVSEGGLGDFFAQVSQLGTWATHSGVVVREVEDGFPVWATVEMASGAHYRLISNEESRIYWRPNFPMRANFTASAAKNLDALGPIQFDALAKNGIFDARNRPSLYCSELVHFLFKNEFNPKGPLYRSPFDGMRNTLVHLPDVAKQNMVKLGFPPAQEERYAPETLHYSPNLNFVGFSQPASWEQNDAAMSYLYNTTARLNTHMANLLFTKPLKPVTLKFRFQLDAILAAGKLRNYLPAIFSDEKSAAINEVLVLSGNLPRGNAKYRFANLSFKYFKAVGVLNDVLRNHGAEPPDVWKPLFEKKLAEEAFPLVEALFKENQ